MNPYAAPHAPPPHVTGAENYTRLPPQQHPHAAVDYNRAHHPVHNGGYDQQRPR